jgi:DNA-3-methyladenine glycosylase
MFAGPGLAYVYFVFGMHWCLNITCAEPGSAVLVRAGEVVDGLDLARARADAGAGLRVGLAGRELARGPGRLARALGIDGTASGTPLLDGTGPVLLAPAVERVDPAAIEAGPRVGVAAAAELPWRFWLRGEPTVSAYRRHVPRRRSARA